MLKVDKLSEVDVIIQSLTPTKPHEFSADEYRVGLRKLKKLFKVGNSASISVDTKTYWYVTYIRIKVKEETEAVKKFVEAVAELSWRNPEDDLLHDNNAGGNVSVEVRYMNNRSAGEPSVDYFDKGLYSRGI